MTENIIVDGHSSVVDPGFLIEDVSLPIHNGFLRFTNQLLDDQHVS